MMPGSTQQTLANPRPLCASKGLGIAIPGIGFTETSYIALQKFCDFQSNVLTKGIDFVQVRQVVALLTLFSLFDALGAPGEPTRTMRIGSLHVLNLMLLFMLHGLPDLPDQLLSIESSVKLCWSLQYDTDSVGFGVELAVHNHGLGGLFLSHYHSGHSSQRRAQRGGYLIQASSPCELRLLLVETNSEALAGFHLHIYILDELCAESSLEFEVAEVPASV